MIEKQLYHFENWEMKSAHYQNDIIWDGLNYNRAKGQVSNLIWFLVLLFVSLLIVTPVSVYSVVDPLTRTLEQNDSIW